MPARPPIKACKPALSLGFAIGSFEIANWEILAAPTPSAPLATRCNPWITMLFGGSIAEPRWPLRKDFLRPPVPRFFPPLALDFLLFFAIVVPFPFPFGLEVCLERARLRLFFRGAFFGARRFALARLGADLFLADFLFFFFTHLPPILCLIPAYTPSPRTPAPAHLTHDGREIEDTAVFALSSMASILSDTSSSTPRLFAAVTTGFGIIPCCARFNPAAIA